MTGIQLHNVCFGYAPETTVLRDIALNVEQGDFLLIVGANGAGKSTLLRLLNGILKPNSGTIHINGLDTTSTPVSTLASHVSVTFQNPGDQIFASTVRQEIMFGPRTLRRPSPENLAQKSMDLCGLSAYASRHPYDLAPAYRKLLTIASAVATDSPILAFDEPTASLSQPERLILSNVFEELRRQHRTLLVVSHDLEFFVPLMDRLVLLNRGMLAAVTASANSEEYIRLIRSAGLTLPLALRFERIALLTRQE
jgi:energy-coupling factor transporter ATP-binding protein EcfA2